MTSIAAGRIIAGRYRLERPIARGGMGSLWAARNVQLDSPIAIKFMDPAYTASEEARARFEREAKAAAQLQSPNVAQVHDYGVEDGTPYIAMEILHGEDLGARLKREGRLTLAATAEILSQAGRALRRAHGLGIVHRDLKPANIYLAKDEDVEIVKVLDFGIAKTSGLGEVSEVTKTGQLLGSPHYMSPEQARRSRQVDHRSDLWALSVIAYRCVTGHLPFPGMEIGDVIVKICAEAALPPSRHLPSLSPEVDRFFEKALAKSPDQRFQSARDLATAFTVVAGSEPCDVASSHPGRTAPPFALEVSSPSFPPLPGPLLPAAARFASGGFTPRSDATPNAQIPSVTPPAVTPTSGTPGPVSSNPPVTISPVIEARPSWTGGAEPIVDTGELTPPSRSPDLQLASYPLPGVLPAHPSQPRADASGAWPTDVPSGPSLMKVAGDISIMEEMPSPRRRGLLLAIAAGGLTGIVLVLGLTLYGGGDNPSASGDPAPSAVTAASEAQPVPSATDSAGVAAAATGETAAPAAASASTAPPRGAPSATTSAKTTKAPLSPSPSPPPRKKNAILGF